MKRYVKSINLSRRAVLRGVGTAMSLPLLEAMLPVGKTAFAQSTGSPARFIGCFSGCGTWMDAFRMPDGPITAATLSPTCQPLAGVADKVCQIKNLSNLKDGSSPGGDHSQGTQIYLRTNYDLASVDEVARRQHVAAGGATRFGTLNMNSSNFNAFDGGQTFDLSRISWSGRSTPNSTETSPAGLFTKVFSDLDPNDAPAGGALSESRKAADESVLSLVKGHVERLTPRLSALDRQTLDQYLTSVEELERQVASAPVANGGGACRIPDPLGNIGTTDTPARLRAYSDMIVLALQCDVARYITYMFENGGNYSQSAFPNIGASVNHHAQSHDNGAGPTILAIDKFFVTEFAYLVQKLSDAKDFTGKSLLDSVFVTYSNEISHGNFHTHNDMPFLTAGSCNGYFKTGQTITANRAFGNMWVSVLDALGFPQASFGDFTGGIPEIVAS